MTTRRNANGGLLALVGIGGYIIWSRSQRNNGGVEEGEVEIGDLAISLVEDGGQHVLLETRNSTGATTAIVNDTADPILGRIHLEVLVNGNLVSQVQEDFALVAGGAVSYTEAMGNAISATVPSTAPAGGVITAHVRIIDRSDGTVYVDEVSESLGTVVTPDPDPDPEFDAFGVLKLYPSVAGAMEWNSAHWNNGSLRILAGDPAPEFQSFDPDDPTGWSWTRGGHDFYVDGQGMGGSSRDMLVEGSSASLRFGINPAHASGTLFRNLEATMYYRRIEDDNPNFGGMVFGVREAIDGGTCRHIYHARIGNDGVALFVKVLNGSAASNRAIVQVFSGGLPFNEWIGMKFVAFDQMDGSVKLELYMDLTNGVDGGDWQLITEHVDAGGWATSDPCLEETDFIIRRSGQVFIRNDWGTNSQPLPEDFLECDYKWVSVRPIALV